MIVLLLQILPMQLIMINDKRPTAEGIRMPHFISVEQSLLERISARIPLLSEGEMVRLESLMMRFVSSSFSSCLSYLD